MTTTSVGYTSSGRASKRRDIILVTLLTLLALLLRSTRLDFQPLWWDEGYSVWFANQSLLQIARLTALDIHPPLYYVLLSLWTQFFGLGPVALRWFSVLVGVAAVPLIYLVGYGLSGRRVGLAGAVLLAINPLHIYYSQEVRMYALMTVWSLLAVGAAGRWLRLGRRIRHDYRPPAPRWLGGYVAAITLALYTQYYAGFLLVGIALAGLLVLWQQRAERAQFLTWLGAQGLAGVLFLPWVIYAGPKLVPYVSQKVVVDADRPLNLFSYLFRHFSAFSIGHLEGPLASWWPLGLIGLILLASGLVRLWQQRPLQAGHGLTLRFLGVILTVVLALGWLVNLTYPFFPERGERLLLLVLPVFLLLLAVTWSPPDPIRSREQQLVLLPARSALPRLFVGSMIALAVLSLSAFYTEERYPQEDYRPLIGQVMQWGRAEDTVFAIYPWQVGYFWSYGNKNGPQPILSPSVEWGSEITTVLDEALARGHVWFPMHLSLGGILETDVEQYLYANDYQLANRWYSTSTRVTGWMAPPQAGSTIVEVPATFDDGVVVTVRYTPRTLLAANDVLPVTLELSNTEGDHIASLSLVGPDGRLWAQQDIPVAQDGTERVGLLVPAGMPAGIYALRFGLAHPDSLRPIGLAQPDDAATEVTLGDVIVQTPPATPPIQALPIEHRYTATLGDTARLLGYSATGGVLLPGDDLTINLFWQGLADAGRGDYAAFIQLLDNNGQVAVGWEGLPVAWHPTNTWQPGELVRSQHVMRLPATLSAGKFTLVAGLFDPVTGERLSATWPSGPFNLFKRTAPQASLGKLRIGERKRITTAPQPRVRTDASMAQLGKLLGYDVSLTRVAPGEPLTITLYWQPTESTNTRYTVFIHLIDEQGVIVGQSDSEPMGGNHPTSSWLPDEYITDQHTITVDSNALLGSAKLLVGFYDPVSGQRIPWVNSERQITGDALTLPTNLRITTIR